MNSILRQICLSVVFGTSFFSFVAPAFAQINLYLCEAAAKADCTRRWGGIPTVSRYKNSAAPGAIQINNAVSCKYVENGINRQHAYGGCYRVFYNTSMSVPQDLPGSCSSKKTGSVIEHENQIIHEHIPIVGTPFQLVYSSNQAHAYTANLEADFNFELASIAQQAHVESQLGSQTPASSVLSTSTNASAPFSWNGLDGGGQKKMMSERLAVTIGYYNSNASECAQLFDGSLICSGGSYGGVSGGGVGYGVPVYERPYFVYLGGFRAMALRLGGWKLSIQHAYDTEESRIYFGTGGSKKVNNADTLAVGVSFRVASDDGLEVYDFNSTGLHIATRHGLTGTLKYSFAYSLTHLVSITDAFGRVTTINRDSSYNFTGITAPSGQVTDVTLNADKLLTEVVNPASEKYEMTYHGTGDDGLLHTFKRPRGQISTFTYDAKGRLLSDSNSAGHGWTVTRATGSAGSKNVSMVSAMGRTHSAVYSPTNSDTFDSAHTQPNSFAETFTATRSNTQAYANSFYSETRKYESDSRLPGSGRYVSDFTRVISGFTNYNVKRADTVTFNSPNNPFDIDTLTTTLTEGTKITTSVYDGATKTFTKTSPAGRISKMTINSHQQPVSIKNSDFSPQTLAYDSQGRLTTVNQGTRTYIFDYNSEGFVESVENAVGEKTTYAYDLVGRLTSQTLPDLRVVTYQYDANGNLLSITPPGRPTHSFVMNLKDLVSGYEAPSLGFGVINTTYAYNNDKQLIQIVRPSGVTITHTYNATTGDRTSINDGSKTFQFSYYKGLVSSAVSPDGITSSHLYQGGIPHNTSYAANGGMIYVGYRPNLKPLYIQIGANPSFANYFTYDNDDLLVQTGTQTYSRSASTGLIQSTAIGSVSETFSYDIVYGELASRQTKFNTTNLLNEVYTRDQLGRVLTRTVTVGASTADNYTYTYDDSGRLKAVDKNGSTISSYIYGVNSVRDSVIRGGAITSGTYDAQDQLVAWGTNTYTYNLNGERSQKVDSATLPGTTDYTWDSWGNLKSVQLPNGTTQNYRYDAFNRLVTKLVGATISERYLYIDQTKLSGVLDSSGVTQITYVWGEKPNTPEYMIKGGVNYKLVTDHVGSIRMVVNSTTGAIAQEIEYDEFGRVLSDSSPGFQPLGFAGGLYDSATGLTQFGARWYDAEVGRWLSKDPILFGGGDTNLYGYTFNDPVNFIDPNGLRTTVLITRDYGFGTHAAAAVSGQGNVFDPAGGASPRGTGNFFEGSMSDFVTYHQRVGSQVQAYSFNTTPSQEALIFNNMLNAPFASPFQCASTVCSVLGGVGPFSGLNHTAFPGRLGRQLENTPGGSCENIK